MNNLVKVIRNDDGFLTKDDSWHLVDPENQLGNATLCTGELFGGGESGVEFELKTVKKGGITCAKCLAKLKAYKSVKL